MGATHPAGALCSLMPSRPSGGVLAWCYDQVERDDGIWISLERSGRACKLWHGARDWWKGLNTFFAEIALGPPGAGWCGSRRAGWIGASCITILIAEISAIRPVSAGSQRTHQPPDLSDEDADPAEKR